MKTFKDLLEELSACDEAIEWAGDKTIEEVVAECERGDWLEWLTRRIDIDNRKRVLAGGLCANTVRHLMKDERSLKAVDVAIAYGKGEASEKDLNAAREAAAAAAAGAEAGAEAGALAAWAAVEAGALAAWAALEGALEGALAAWAAAAAAAGAGADAGAGASWAADAAYAAAAYADAAKDSNRQQTAAICREVMGDAIINKLNEMLK